MFAELRHVLAATTLFAGLSELICSAHKPLYRNGYALVLSSAASSGLGLAYWALAARWYSAENVGANSAAISTMLLVAGISHLDLGNVLLRFLPRAGRSTERLLRWAYVTDVCATACVSLLVLATLRTWVPTLAFLTLSPLQAAWFVGATIAWGILGLQDDVLAALREARWVPVKNLAVALAKLALVVPLAGEFSQTGIWASWTIPTVLSLPVLIFLTYRWWIPNVAGRDAQAAPLPGWTDLARFAGGNYVGTLFTIAGTTLVPIMVVQTAGTVAGAYFYVPWVMGSALQLLGSNMAISVIVEGSLNRSKLEAYSRGVMVHLAIVMAPVVIFILVAAPYLLNLLGSAYATESSGLLRLLAVGTLPAMINAMYVAQARVRCDLVTIAAVQSVLSVLILVASYELLLRFGITGVGVAWLAAQTLVATFVISRNLGARIRCARVMQTSAGRVG
jgi:O-antigen/teichoic acid export membrane protein